MFLLLKKNVVKNIQESGISKSPVGCGNGKEYLPGLMMEKGGWEGRLGA